MKPEINLPRVYSGKISLGKTMFPWAKVRSVTSTFVSHTETGLQAIIDRFATVCQDFVLTIIRKIEVLAMWTHAELTILITNQALNSVDAFKYLGSTIISNLCLDSDLNAPRDRQGSLG